jgi:hypothetical protein
MTGMQVGMKLFAFYNPTNNFDGNWNGTSIIACKSDA